MKSICADSCTSRRVWGPRNGWWLFVIALVSLVNTCGVVATEVTSKDHARTPVVTAGLPTVNIRLVAKDTFSFGPEEIASEPLSDNVTFLAGSVFNLEIWAQVDDPGGLSSVSLDVSFDPNEVIVSDANDFPFSGGIFHGFIFASLTNGTGDNVAGKIDDLSGSYVPGGGCTANPTAVGPLKWSRVGVVEMLAVIDTSPMILPGSTGNLVFGTAVCGMGNSPESNLHYTGINANSADFNGDSVIDLLDHFFFLSCQSGPSGGLVAPPCDVADIDDDGDVDLKDWSWFQSHFQ